MPPTPSTTLAESTIPAPAPRGNGQKSGPPLPRVRSRSGDVPSPPTAAGRRGRTPAATSRNALWGSSHPLIALGRQCSRKPAREHTVVLIRPALSVVPRSVDSVTIRAAGAPRTRSAPVTAHGSGAPIRVAVRAHWWGTGREGSCGATRSALKGFVPVTPGGRLALVPHSACATCASMAASIGPVWGTPFPSSF